MLGARRAFGIGMLETFFLWFASTVILFFVNWWRDDWIEAHAAASDAFVASIVVVGVYLIWHITKIPPMFHVAFRTKQAWDGFYGEFSSVIQDGYEKLNSVGPHQSAEQFHQVLEDWKQSFIDILNKHKLPYAWQRQFLGVGQDAFNPNSATASFFGNSEKWASLVYTSTYPNAEHQNLHKQYCEQFKGHLKNLENMQHHCFHTILSAEFGGKQ